MSTRLRQAQDGFTLIELAIVMAVLGLLLIPTLTALNSLLLTNKQDQSQVALKAARDALLAYAAQNKGCLPQAADFEGGVPDTNAAGLGGTPDTGRLIAAPLAAQRAGDVPWADLGIPNQQLDGHGYRLQYYVASAYTSPTQAGLNDGTRDDCPARLRTGIEFWDNTARYAQGDVVQHNNIYYAAAVALPAVGTAPPSGVQWTVLNIFPYSTAQVFTANSSYAIANDEVYLALASGTLTAPPGANWRAAAFPGLGRTIPAYSNIATYRLGELVQQSGRIFRYINNAPAIAPAPTAGMGDITASTSWRDLSLPRTISANDFRSLQTRVGPDVTAAPGNISASNFNVFVLIAASTDPNAQIANRAALRDATHRTCTAPAACVNWATLNDADVDNRVFSSTANSAATPNGGNIILPVSFTEYQSQLMRFNNNTQPRRY